MAQVIDARTEGLREGFDGEVLVGGDRGYDDARALFNGSIDRRPAVIARCRTTQDVARSIAFAREQGLEMAVRGGGHSFSGQSVVDDGLMIDLSPMRDVKIDVEGRRAVVGGGASLADFDGAAQEHGLACPGGMISHTGIAGLTLGGGMGHLTRKHGLSIDNLLSVELVAADGRIVRASESENEELFWGLRGGGGNFGVVTSFEYRLHPVGPLVQMGLFFWPAAQGVEGLRLCRDVAAEAPDDIGVFIGGLSLPPAPFVPEQHIGTTGFALIISGFDADDAHARLVERVRGVLPALVELVTPMPYTALQQMFDEGAPWGIHCYDKGTHLDELSDDVIDVLVEHTPRKHSPMSLIPIFALGGAYTRVAQDTMAYNAPRRPSFAVSGAAVVPDPAMLEVEREWSRKLNEALRPHQSKVGRYVNFMADYDDADIVASYGREKYDRLARLKAEYDPDNVFHRNVNVKPAR